MAVSRETAKTRPAGGEAQDAVAAGAELDDVLDEPDEDEPDEDEPEAPELEPELDESDEEPLDELEESEDEDDELSLDPLVTEPERLSVR